MSDHCLAGISAESDASCPPNVATPPAARPPARRADKWGLAAVTAG